MGKLPNFEKSYNITPSTYNPVIIRNSPNKAVMMKWGFIPAWSKDRKFSLINIRMETLNEKAYFKNILLKNRCLIPADGFYEWKKLDLEGKEEKVPYYFQLEKKGLFSFAGLYSKLTDAEGKDLFTYAIITCHPNSTMKNIHNRMPVIFASGDEDVWLNPDEHSLEKLQNLLLPFSGKMLLHPVSYRVNNPANDDKRLIENV